METWSSWWRGIHNCMKNFKRVGGVWLLLVSSSFIMGPPKKKKLVQSLNKTLRKAEKRNLEKAKQERREQQLAKTNKQKIYERKPTFDDNDRILLIGEGNFSFARAIADHYMQRNPALITATCLDSESVLYEKYGDEAKDNIEALQDLGVTVLFEVDGTQLNKHKLIRKNRYTKIIFNFPHAGNKVNAL